MWIWSGHWGLTVGPEPDRFRTSGLTSPHWRQQKSNLITVTAEQQSSHFIIRQLNGWVPSSGNVGHKPEHPIQTPDTKTNPKAWTLTKPAALTDSLLMVFTESQTEFFNMFICGFNLLHHLEAEDSQLSVINVSEPTESNPTQVCLTWEGE